MLVWLRKKGQDEDATARLEGWAKTEGEGPFIVRQRPDRDHVTLARESDPEHVIHFGSTGCAWFHIAYVELRKSGE